MVTAVPSRFAVLSIDDDDYKPIKVQKTLNTKTNSKNKEDKVKQLKKDDKKKQNKGKKKKTIIDGQQWEQWKQKDAMAVEETYEQQLHEAILQSKLSFQEEQMEVHSKPEHIQDNLKKATSKKSKKSTMSLDEFNKLNNATAPNIEPTIEKKISTPIDTRFFETIEKETSQELIKEKEKAALKERLNRLDDNITSAQLRAEIEKRDDIINELKSEVEILKQELNNVKHRNKKLYQILHQGEMKDKATVLAEVTKLQEIRDELTSEVTLLHAQLEQERSKPRASSIDVKTSKQIELFVHYLSQEAHQKSNKANNLEYKHLADKNYKGSHGQSPLHLAAAYGHHDVVKLLLNYGADPNASEDERNTPLIYGAQGDHPDVCYELLTRGADITMTNANGLNAYKAAILKNASTAKSVIKNCLVHKIVNLSPDIF
ncbi:G kinase-anchoring protein 1 isoform X2 [Nasonia vitripennis]|nr:G kinase-anchoring protein 1 isoform X2 [Nasonia vitripennis]XP_031781744.1 G kinase-anchoring protein 1 isoform X2 [Nasonia vitripennis]XP_032457685.1 G kinase-anchoring protein 1 isoform X2 [Nasonia vitripennis]XP_032457686.1 G kinase-anchoring protein 1 isoform X2 [Nasonia vitripennis]